MRLLTIRPKGWYFEFEISIEDAKLLLGALGKADMKFDGKDSQEAAEAEYLKKFYGLLDSYVKEVPE